MCYSSTYQQTKYERIDKLSCVREFRDHVLFLLTFTLKFRLRWFETVFHFPFQLNFMKGLLVCSKRLLLLVDSRCCNNLSTYQLLYSRVGVFGPLYSCHGNNIYVGSTRIEKLEAVVTPSSTNSH